MSTAVLAQRPEVCRVARHLGLVAARLHAVLVHRPGSDVFHVYAGPLTPSGRFVPRAARPVCSARTRRLTVIPRIGVTIPIGDRRMCAHCAARLDRSASRAAHSPTNVHERRRFWESAGVTSADLVLALALTSSVAETHAISNVTTLLKGFFDVTNVRRPTTPGPAQGRWDFETELLRRRRELVAKERSDDERADNLAARDAEAMEREQARTMRIRQAQADRLQDRDLSGQYVPAWERDRLTRSA